MDVGGTSERMADLPARPPGQGRRPLERAGRRRRARPDLARRGAARARRPVRAHRPGAVRRGRARRRRAAGGPGRAVPQPGQGRLHAERDGARRCSRSRRPSTSWSRTPPTWCPSSSRFSRLVDDLGLRTFEAYSAAREQIIADQSTAMMELSTPVVRLWDGIIAVPLVGTLDSARTQLVMEKLLEHAGGDRRRPRGDRHHRRADGGHRGGAAPAQDGQRGPPARRGVHHLRHPAAGRADDRVARHRVRRHRHQGDAGRRARARAAARPA